MAEKKNATSPFWVRVQELLDRPKRKKMGVNIGKISECTVKGQTVVVPDKVLSGGKLAHAIDVAAEGFSSGALKAIKSAGGKAMAVADAKKANPTGKGCAIIA